MYRQFGFEPVTGERAGSFATLGEDCNIGQNVFVGEGVTIGARNVLTRGVRVFPQTELPDGAITF